jgi:hypothetical protein
MPTIRIPEAHWGKVWRVLVASGPTSCIGKDPSVYIVSERQINLLRRKKLPYQLISVTSQVRLHLLQAWAIKNPWSLL